MKKEKIVKVGILVLSILVLFISCASKSGVTKNVETEGQAKKAMDDNDVSVNAQKIEIIDWQDRGIGAKVNPLWLKKLVKGNPNLFLEEYDLADQYTNHKWFSYGVQNQSLDVAESIARSEILNAVAEEMAVTINSMMGTDLSDGQKSAIKKIWSEVENVQLSGVGFRTSYWQLQVTTDSQENKQRLYNYYAFYSCSTQKYNELLNNYLAEILQNKNADDITKKAIAKKAQEILDNGQKQNEDIEQKRETELKAELANMEEYKKTSTEKNNLDASNSEMSPALAALVATF